MSRVQCGSIPTEKPQLLPDSYPCLHIHSANLLRHFLREQWRIQGLLHRLFIQLRQRNDSVRAVYSGFEWLNAMAAGHPIHPDVPGESRACFMGDGLYKKVLFRKEIQVHH